uniref:Uncharacterized protein n=1 Tax=Opuntia streptacantha TaxID=393608 RepID=A0A7C9ENC3_OPUST
MTHQHYWDIPSHAEIYNKQARNACKGNLQTNLAQSTDHTQPTELQGCQMNPNDLCSTSTTEENKKRKTSTTSKTYAVSTTERKVTRCNSQLHVSHSHQVSQQSHLTREKNIKYCS